MLLDDYHVHFEVHVFETGRWKIDYVCKDQREALEVARDLLRWPGIAGVRVIKEVYNSARNVTAARTIFEEIRPDRRPRMVALHSLAAAERASLLRRAGAAGTDAISTPASTGLPGSPAPAARPPRCGQAMGMAALLSLAAGASGTVTLIWFTLVG